MFAELFFVELVGVILPQVFHHAYQETGRSGSGITDQLVCFGLHHINHHADNMLGRAKLPVDTGRRELGEQVLVEVALGVPVIELNFIEHLHHPVKQLWRVDLEVRVPHGLCKQAPFSADGFDKVKHPSFLPEQAEHLLGVFVFEDIPTKLPLSFRENGILDFHFQLVCLFFFQLLLAVKAADKKQIGNLLDNAQRVRHPVLPEFPPYSVDIASLLSC